MHWVCAVREEPNNGSNDKQIVALNSPTAIRFVAGISSLESQIPMHIIERALLYTHTRNTRRHIQTRSAYRRKHRLIHQMLFSFISSRFGIRLEHAGTWTLTSTTVYFHTEAWDDLAFILNVNVAELYHTQNRFLAVDFAGCFLFHLFHTSKSDLRSIALLCQLDGSFRSFWRPANQTKWQRQNLIA